MDGSGGSGLSEEEFGSWAVKVNEGITFVEYRSRVDRLLGRNIATAVVRQTELPVLLVRPTDDWASRTAAFQKLLVCLDGSEGSEEILPWARILARHFGSTILLLAVPEAESEMPRLEHYLQSVAARSSTSASPPRYE